MKLKLDPLMGEFQVVTKTAPIQYVEKSALDT